MACFLDEFRSNHPTPVLKPHPVPGMHFHLLRTTSLWFETAWLLFQRGEQLLRERNN